VATVIAMVSFVAASTSHHGAFASSGVGLVQFQNSSRASAARRS